MKQNGNADSGASAPAAAPQENAAVDLARVASLISLGGAAIFGAAGAALLKFLGGAASAMIALVMGLITWTVLSFLAASTILRRRDF